MKSGPPTAPDSRIARTVYTGDNEECLGIKKYVQLALMAQNGCAQLLIRS